MEGTESGLELTIAIPGMRVQTGSRKLTFLTSKRYYWEKFLC